MVAVDSVYPPYWLLSEFNTVTTCAVVRNCVLFTHADSANGYSRYLYPTNHLVNTIFTPYLYISRYNVFFWFTDETFEQVLDGLLFEYRRVIWFGKSVTKTASTIVSGATTAVVGIAEVTATINFIDTQQSR